ncbi:MAG: hypothetical protein JSV91_04525 [Phycisphaerales bacterium]|nr:MAG: hypothetical protein JSV91_04525 [Phycisphaerales bacterium]
MTALRMILLIGVCGALLSGCGKEEEATPTTAAPGGGTAAGAKSPEEAGSALGDLAQQAGEEAREALDAFKAEYREQLVTHESKVEALKASARAFTDENLSSLLSSLDEKLATARAKLGEMANADEGAVAALKNELTGLMDEIPRLYEQALARFNELKGVEVPDLPEGGGLPGMPGG